MPVCGLFVGAILAASYYYSIKIRRGARCAAPQECPPEGAAHTGHGQAGLQDLRGGSAKG